LIPGPRRVPDPYAQEAAIEQLLGRLTPMTE